MNFKKFAIFSCVIVAIIAATMVVLGCIRVNSKLDIEEPTTFVYYLKTSVGLEKTKTDSPKIYNNLKKKVDEMTNLSIFDYMAKGISLKAKPGQDYDNNFPPYRNLNKEEGFFLEMQYERTQTIVVEIDGNTKVVEFTGLMMQVKNSARASEVALYFSTSTGSSKSYKDNPIIIVAKQKNLYRYLNTLVED